MSQSPGSSTQCGSLNSVPGWIASGMLGLAIGAGATVVVMRNAHIEDLAAQEKAWAAAASNSTGTPPPAGTSSPGGPGPGGGGPPAMGMGGMGGGRGGMGGGGGGGGGKRALTALVGKLELLSRPDMKLHVELNADQAKAIADKLEAFDKAEKMTGDEAQESADALEALLTPEQKEVVNAIGLPGGGRGGPGGGGGGGGGRGAAGRPGGGGPPSGGPPGGGPPGGGPPGGGPGGPMMMMGGGGNPDENPFTQEANQKRLRDLRDRLSPASAEGGAKPE